MITKFIHDHESSWLKLVLPDNQSGDTTAYAAALNILAHPKFIHGFMRRGCPIVKCCLNKQSSSLLYRGCLHQEFLNELRIS